MRIAFLLLIVVHGLIHLMGFAKAFKFAEIAQLTQNISKFYGIIWLISAVLMIGAAVFFLLGNKWWWVEGLIAVLISQFIIFVFWKDAKFGTIANLIILIPVIVLFFKNNFDQKISQEVQQIFSSLPTGQADITIPENRFIQKEDLAPLPSPVQKWLTHSGIIGKERTFAARVRQKGKLKTKPDQKWMDFTSEQYFTTTPPAFIWKADIKMNPLIQLQGRDKFVAGKGNMLIKLSSLFKVVDASGEQIDQGSLQRFLAEMMWFPSAATSSYLEWEMLDSTSAKATMTWQGTTGDGIFYFNKNGLPKSFSTKRYMAEGDHTTLKTWQIEIKDYQKFDDVLLPSKFEIIWKLDAGDFKWMEMELTAVDYNQPFTF